MLLTDLADVKYTCVITFSVKLISPMWWTSVTTHIHSTHLCCWQTELAGVELVCVTTCSVKHNMTIVPIYADFTVKICVVNRAGRCRAGVCYHLFSRARHASMMDYQQPEILRLQLHVSFVFGYFIIPRCKRRIIVIIFLCGQIWMYCKTWLLCIL